MRSARTRRARWAPRMRRRRPTSKRCEKFVKDNHLEDLFKGLEATANVTDIALNMMKAVDALSKKPPEIGDFLKTIVDSGADCYKLLPDDMKKKLSTAMGMDPEK